RARQLLQPPRARRLAQQRAHDAGGPRREQRAQRSRRRADVALAFFLDQDVLKGDVAVAGQIDVPKVVGLENPCALRRDIDRGGQGVCRRDLPSDVAQPRHGGRIWRGCPSEQTSAINRYSCSPSLNFTIKSAVWP